MRRVLVLLVAALLVVAACGGGAERAQTNTTTTELGTTTTTEATTVATTEGTPSVALMPDIPCGTDLQAAQDRVQETGVFFSRSEDATGQGRHQMLDRNWTVTRSTPAPGTPIGEGDVVFYVVKDTEFTGC